MSAASLKAIAERTRARLVDIRSASEGQALFHEFQRALGSEFAETVFLKMTSELEAATDETAAEVFDWAQGFPQVAMNMLAEGVRSAFPEQGQALGLESERAEEAAISGFAARLEALFGAGQSGGKA